MKTKELIRQLMEADPSGELECCVDNHDILFVNRLPGYYDGRLEVLTRDPALKHCFDVVGGKVTSRGEKLKIAYMPIEHLLIDFPEVPIDLGELNERDVEDWHAKVERWRARGRRFSAGCFDHPDDQD